MPVPPKPRRVRTLVVAACVVVAAIAVHWVAVDQTEFSLAKLFHGLHGIWSFFFGDARTKGALPPDLHWATVKEALHGSVQTFSMGLLGTTLSVPLALLLALLGARTTSRNVVVYQLSRVLMSIFRAVPSFIWGLVFVTAVGIGPFPGVLAIIVHNVGVMGKLWSEAMEEVDEGPVEALRSSGASSAQTATHVVLPSVLPTFVSLFLYRVDVNFRDALALGIVGAGGLGFLITRSVQEFQFSQMMTEVVMVYVIVQLLDSLSAWLRARITR
jgi:phosphonate transport system permease protein